MGGIAQLVEHRPFKAGVDGSSPSALILWPHRLAWSRTTDFRSVNWGSNPHGVIC